MFFLPSQVPDHQPLGILPYWIILGMGSEPSRAKTEDNGALEQAPLFLLITIQTCGR
jgi:hypothetical protein